MALEMQKSNATKLPSTQGYLRLAEIRDNCVIMQDGTLRAIVAVSSTNFDLKNEEEQNGLIYSYQRFLNSIEFPIQILMQSRKIDVADYVEKLNTLMERQPNELLKAQTNEYIDFINKLIENANIMSKSFYVVIPYWESINPPAQGFFAKIFGGGKSQQLSQRLENFKKYSELLDQRVTSIVSNISSLGIRAIRLQTPELIELYYSSYNFESAPTLDASKLGDIKVIETNQQPTAQ